jgi:hypothetical protein
MLLLSISTGLKAEYFTDVIITSPNGIWTDSRAYATLNAAITAVGANQRTIKIVSPQVVTSLTIPANVTLEFDRDGSITNSGQLTINTKNIIAPNRQIFTGVGNIDFAPGSVVKTGWFSNIESAFALTNNDTVTLIVSKSQTITASYSPGNNVTLKWESPGNILTVNAGVIVGNINNIEAGKYQLFAGAGDFDFTAGSVIRTSWFAGFRYAVNFTDDAVDLTLLVDRSEIVDLDIALTTYQGLEVEKGCLITVNPGMTLIVNNLKGGLYQIFAGTGSVIFNSAVVKREWFSSLTNAVGMIGTQQITLTNETAYTLTANITIPLNISTIVYKGAIIYEAFAFTLTINGPFDAGSYQVFSGFAVGAVTISTGNVKADWWGFSATATAAVNATAIQSAIDSINTRGGVVKLSSGSFAVASDVIHIGSTQESITLEGVCSMFYYEHTAASATGTTLVFGAGTVGINLTDIASGGNYTIIENMVLDGNSVCADVVKTSGEWVIRGVTIMGSTHAGLWMTNLNVAPNMSYTSIVNNLNYGILIGNVTSPNNNTSFYFNNIVVRSNLIGIRITNAMHASIRDSVIESNTQEGVQIYKENIAYVCDNLIFDNVWFENNWLLGTSANYQVTIDSVLHNYTTGPVNYVVFTNCRFTGVLGGSQGVDVQCARIIDFVNCGGGESAINLGAFCLAAHFTNWNGSTITDGGVNTIHTNYNIGISGGIQHNQLSPLSLMVQGENTIGAITSCADASATVVYTFPHSHSMVYYQVFVRLHGVTTTSASDYAAYALIAADSSPSILHQVDGAKMKITVVGLNILVTQSNGATRNVAIIVNRFFNVQPT